jgi:alpha-N-arabinofuranosidase
MPAVQCDTFDVPGYAINNFRQYAPSEGLQYLEGSGSLYEENEALSLFVINRSADDQIETELDLRGFEGYTLRSTAICQARTLTPETQYSSPDLVSPRAITIPKWKTGRLRQFSKSSHGIFFASRKHTVTECLVTSVYNVH